MFKFIYEGEDYRNELTVEESGLTHMEVMEWVEQFLKGCGYSFDGHYELLTDFESDMRRERIKRACEDRMFSDEKTPDDYALAM